MKKLFMIFIDERDFFRLLHFLNDILNTLCKMTKENIISRNFDVQICISRLTVSKHDIKTKISK